MWAWSVMVEVVVVVVAAVVVVVAFVVVVVVVVWGVVVVLTLKLTTGRMDTPSRYMTGARRATRCSPSPLFKLASP